MAQSSTDSNLRGIPAFWPNHTVEPPTQWTNWIDQFRLAIIAKESLDIDNLKEPLEQETTIPILEGAQDSENEPQRKAREAWNKKFIRIYEQSEEKRMLEEKRKLGGMRRYGADKKSKIDPIPGLVSWRKESVFSKTPKDESSNNLFQVILVLLEAAFIKPTNIPFERYKLLSRKQKERES